MCYVLLFGTSLKDVVRVREKARGNTNEAVGARMYHQILFYFFKLGISDCGPFVDAYFQPATSMDRLQVVNCTDTIKNLVVFLTNVIKGDN